MNKLRSDSAFCQLTPQQADALETWLFEERLGYPKVVERLKAEFELETSLTGVRRFYKRLDLERSAQSLIDAADMSGLTVEALKSVELKPAMLMYANKCLFDLLRQSPVPIKEVTTLLRAITSAEARAFRQTVDDREQAELKEAERLRKVEAERRWARREIAREDEELRQKQAARKKAKLAAAEKAAKESASMLEKKSNKGSHLSPAQWLPKPATSQSPEESRALRATWSPRGGEGEELAQRVALGESAASIVPARPELSDSLALRGTSGARAGERGFSTNPSNANRPATKDAESEWHPSVLEEREDAENDLQEAAENRLAPLNAA